jgi:hypothetical protein
VKNRVYLFEAACPFDMFSPSSRIAVLDFAAKH